MARKYLHNKYKLFIHRCCIEAKGLLNEGASMMRCLSMKSKKDELTLTLWSTGWLRNRQWKLQWVEELSLKRPHMKVWTLENSTDDKMWHVQCLDASLLCWVWWTWRNCHWKYLPWFCEGCKKIVKNMTAVRTKKLIWNIRWFKDAQYEIIWNWWSEMKQVVKTARSAIILGSYPTFWSSWCSN